MGTGTTSELLEKLHWAKFGVISKLGNKYCIFDTETNELRPDLGLYEEMIDLSEGYIGVCNHSKWGVISFTGKPIAPTVYDFVELDEWDYARFCIIAGRNVFFYKTEHNNFECYYKGIYDIYNADGLLISGLTNYNNGNHPINNIMIL